VPEVPGQVPQVPEVPFAVSNKQVLPIKSKDGGKIA
jgi:hypothetical protein